MEQVRILWQTLLALCGAVAVIGGGVRMVAGWFSPVREIKKKLDAHTEQLERDHQRIGALREHDEVTMQAMLALLDHAITGNSVDKLKAARECLHTHLIRR